MVRFSVRTNVNFKHLQNQILKVNMQNIYMKSNCNVWNVQKHYNNILETKILKDFAYCKLYFDLCRVGLDLYQGTVRDNKKAGVLEPAMSKIKSLKFATEAAITILRIDDMIKLVDQERGRGKTYQDALNAGEL